MSGASQKKESHCPVATTLALIGGKHKALILWNLLEGTMRYSELRRAVPEATPKMLTQQLRDLETNGLITRTVYPVVPPRVEYALTEEGESIRPILTAMYRWGTQYLEGRNIHACCSMTPPTDPDTCSHCGEKKDNCGCGNPSCCCHCHPEAADRKA